MTQSADGRQSPRWFWPMFALGLLACALPFALAPALPMCDINGSAGIVGALLQRANPASRIDQYFTFNVHVSPNALYWAVTYGLAKIMPVWVASNLFIVIFCIVGMPLAYLCALRSLDRHPALAFLALAAVFHRCIWYGFAGSVAAVAFIFLAIACMNHSFSRRGWSWWDGGLAAALLALATAHAFLFLIGFGLWLLFAVLAWHQPSPWYRRFLVAAPAVAYIGPWLASTFGGGGGPGVARMVSHIWSQRQPARTYWTNAHEWFLNGYASSVDEVVVAVFAIALAAGLILGVRPLARDRGPKANPNIAAAPSDWLWNARLPITVALLGGGYLLLPMSIDRPFGWWAVNVRLLVPFLLAVGLLIPSRTRGLPGWALWPLWGAATFYGLYIAYDFRSHWVGVELKGFDAALQAIPPGQRVHAIYPAFEGERHYSHFPMGHIVDWYIVERGGLATPSMTSHPHELWAAPLQLPAAPWGLQQEFSWARHGRYWDYFLVKQPAPGNLGAYTPFRDTPLGEVTRVFESGLWSVWKRVNEPGPAP